MLLLGLCVSGCRHGAGLECGSRQQKIKTVKRVESAAQLFAMCSVLIDMSQTCDAALSVTYMTRTHHASYTGFQSVIKCGSNWPVSCTSHYLVRPLSTWADNVQLLADSGRRLLRSANYRTCVVPRTQNSFDNRDFSVAGPRIWKHLPRELDTLKNILNAYSAVIAKATNKVFVLDGNPTTAALLSVIWIFFTS